MPTDSHDHTNITHEQIKKFYDEVYEQPRGLYEDNPRFYPWILQLLEPHQGACLLDVACGQGGLLHAATQRGLTTAGLDISSVAIKRAQRAVPTSDLRVGQGESLPWPDAHFDYVTNLGSLEHFLDMGQGIREMVRVLKPNGTACILLPNQYWLGSVLEVWRTGQHGADWQIIDRSATHDQWKELLTQHGFRVQRTVRYNRPVKLFDADGRLRSIRKFLWRSFLNAFTPFHLTWHFSFICTKNH